jgi:hypothetical protein
MLCRLLFAGRNRCAAYGHRRGEQPPDHETTVDSRVSNSAARSRSSLVNAGGDEHAQNLAQTSADDILRLV